MDILEDYPEWVEPGAAFSLFYREGNPNNMNKVHIRAIVDDRLVLARWFKHKQRWHYWVEDIYWFSAFQDKITQKRPT